MKKKHMEDKWKESIICVLTLGLAAFVGIGTGGKATEIWKNEETEIVEMQFTDENTDEIFPETGNEIESEAESESETESENETETETELETEIESEAETETETETGTETETEASSETESKVEMETETESEIGTETEGENETESEVETETELELESEIEIETEAESERQTEVETESEIETETEEETETKSEVETEMELESEIGTETEEETEAESEVETEMESGIGIETEAESERESEVETEVETELESEIETETEEETETESEVETETEAETETEQESEKKQVKKPEQIYRGKDYEISGEYNSYYRDANGKLWVRSGTDIYVEPKNGNISEQKIEAQNLCEDGVLMFYLQKKDRNSDVLEKSSVAEEYYYVDHMVPAAEIHVDGTVSDGMIFTGTGADVSVRVRPDTMSGMKKISYQIIRYEKDGTAGELAKNTDWLEWSTGQNISVPEEGIFQIFVRTEDQVGNVAFSGSKPVCIDFTAPVIEIEGVQDQTANAGALPIRVICKDDSYDQGTLLVNIQGINTGRRPEVRTKQENSDGAVISFYDFPQDRMYDDIYEMTVSASDKSGNKTEMTLEFSVNRYGSVYKLSEPTLQEIDEYYIPEGKDVVFYETNIDYVGESSIYVRYNGELKELRKGTDYQVSMSGSENTWKKYRYTIPADCFREEGVYELLLTSVDQAKNTSDTGLQQQSVAFVLDYTVPEAVISGIEAGQVYKEEKVTVGITPSDTGGIQSVRVLINGELEKEYTDIKSDETIYHVLNERGEWQNIQICVTDLAGNCFQSKEIPVWIGREEPVSETERKIQKNLLSVSGNYQERAENRSVQTLSEYKVETERFGDSILLWTGIIVFLLTATGCAVLKKRR